MVRNRSRRDFLRETGIGAGALPFIFNLPSLGFANQRKRKQRLILAFTPNGIVPDTFWPDVEVPAFGASMAGMLGSPLSAAALPPNLLKESLQSRRPFADKILMLQGIKICMPFPGSTHMRGVGCMWTGVD